MQFSSHGREVLRRLALGGAALAVAIGALFVCATGSDEAVTITTVVAPAALFLGVHQVALALASHARDVYQRRRGRSPLPEARVRD